MADRVPAMRLPSCATIVLAAGASTRLGQPKQLVQSEGESLLRRSVRLAAESGCSPVVTVLGRDAGRLHAEVDGLATITVTNTGWASGMASSLRSGLEVVLQKEPASTAALLLVCDQPQLDSDILQRLLEAHRSGHCSITASRYGEVIGVPAIFSHLYFAELMALEGDQGARRVLKKYSTAVCPVDFPGGLLDIDTPEDLHALRALHQQGGQ